jgi:hypothetical protein
MNMETTLQCDTGHQKKGDILGHVIDFSHWLCLFSCISDSDEGIFLTRLSTHPRFGCDRLLMKSTLLREQSTFKAVSRLPFEGINCNIIFLIFDAYAPNDIILVARSQKWGALYWKNEVSFPLHLGFRWKFIPHTVHECARTSVGLVMALYFEDQLPFWLYLGFHWRDFPEIAYLTLPSIVLKRW